MTRVCTDLPFKVGRNTVVVVRDAPVLECPSCPEYLLADAEMVRIEEILASRGAAAEVEVVRYAA